MLACTAIGFSLGIFFDRNLRITRVDVRSTKTEVQHFDSPHIKSAHQWHATKPSRSPNCAPNFRQQKVQVLGRNGRPLPGMLVSLVAVDNEEVEAITPVSVRADQFGMAEFNLLDTVSYSAIVYSPEGVPFRTLLVRDESSANQVNILTPFPSARRSFYTKYPDGTVASSSVLHISSQCRIPSPDGLAPHCYVECLTDENGNVELELPQEPLLIQLVPARSGGVHDICLTSYQLGVEEASLTLTYGCRRLFLGAISNYAEHVSTKVLIRAYSERGEQEAAVCSTTGEFRLELAPSIDYRIRAIRLTRPHPNKTLDSYSKDLSLEANLISAEELSGVFRLRTAERKSSIRIRLVYEGELPTAQASIFVIDCFEGTRKAMRLEEDLYEAFGIDPANSYDIRFVAFEGHSGVEFLPSAIDNVRADSAEVRLPMTRAVVLKGHVRSSSDSMGNALVTVYYDGVRTGWGYATKAGEYNVVAPCTSVNAITIRAQLWAEGVYYAGETTHHDATGDLTMYAR